MRKWLSLLSLCAVVNTFGQSPALIPTVSVNYVANAGLMVTQEDMKVLFDPLFRNSYGHYELPPKAIKAALFANTPPWDGIDAVFISHYHGDHFSPEDILRLLVAQPGVHLYAPSQAVTGLQAITGIENKSILKRVTTVELAYGDEPVTLDLEGLLIEAVRIPHSGWPTTRNEVENIAWRVTLNQTTTVLHMGDADPNDVHFARDAEYWDIRQPHVAFPPYWFFNSRFGLEVLSKRVKPGHSIGVHVPKSIADDPLKRPHDLRGYDLFTEPGEIRKISPKQRSKAELKAER